jgi:N-glycosidase YbiA
VTIDSFSGKYAFLSNFHSAVVELDGVHYPTVEHAYQAAKTLNPTERAEIRVVSAGQAKRLGRKVKIRPDWEAIKVDVMWNLLVQKFQRNNGFGIWLVNTGDAELVEGNHWGDTYWGVCKGEGLNMLGHLLMARRAELRGGKK